MPYITVIVLTMKKLLVALLLIIISYNASAQDSLRYFNQERYHITTTGMKVLGSWGIANTVVGGIGWANSSGQTKYFYQMNTFWGIANIGAAVLGYTGAEKARDKNYTVTETLKEQKKIQKIFLINAGLDVAYIGTGIYLDHRGNTHSDDKLKGYGKAVILQGAFLLLFDGTMYGTHHNNGSKLRNFLARNPITFDGSKVGMLIKL